MNFSTSTTLRAKRATFNVKRKFFEFLCQKSIVQLLDSVLSKVMLSGSKNRIETWIYGKNTLKTGHCTSIPNSLLCPVFRSLSGFSVFRDAYYFNCLTALYISKH